MKALGGRGMWPSLRLRVWDEPGVNGRWVRMDGGEFDEVAVQVDGDGGGRWLAEGMRWTSEPPCKS